jgi:hypothetical protein
MHILLSAILSLLAQPTSADERLASYTAWLTGFTGVLAIGTLGLLWIARQQGKQIEREFISTFRPKLRIRRVSIQATKGVAGGYPIGSIQYLIANVGGSPATLIDGRTVHKLIPKGTRLPAEPPYDDERDSHEVPQGITLKSGESIPIVHHGDISIMPSLGFAFVEHNDLYFFGYVEYTDANNYRRRMAFCRRMDTEGRFLVVETEPDYEYAD